MSKGTELASVGSVVLRFERTSGIGFEEVQCDLYQDSDTVYAIEKES